VRAAFLRHDELIEASVLQHGGRLERRRGAADSRLALLDTPLAALLAAASIMRAMAAEPWTTLFPLSARLAAVASSASGLADPRGAAQALYGLARPGQALFGTLGPPPELPPDLRLRSLGSRTLADSPLPAQIFQLGVAELPELPASLPPATRPGNLSMPATSLVGRAAELVQIQALLAQADGPRLLTLVGPGGVGKTRLALEAGLALQPRFPGGVYLVSLAGVRAPAGVLDELARALGVGELSADARKAAIIAVLREAPALLLLDNLEHLIAAAPLLAELLAAAPSLRLLATSRAELGLDGERELHVAPLALPDQEAGELSHDPLALPAVALFVQRAQAVRPDFQLDAQNAALVAEIVTRLDGLPLAIELAAARVKLLPPQAMLQRLDSRLKMLTGGPRDLPARLQTMRATIGWSYDLLGPEEQVVFARLGVFAGGCTLPGALAVVPLAEDAPQLAVHEAVEALLRNSLLSQNEPPASDDAEPRLLMLETLREFALERLRERGELELLHSRHADYMLALAHLGAARGELLTTLAAEYENLTAAIDWCVAAGDEARATALGAALHSLGLLKHDTALPEVPERHLRAALRRYDACGLARSDKPYYHAQPPAEEA
jgi:predicted ATPase